MCTVENIPKYLGKLNNEIEAMTAGRDNLCSVSGLDYSGQSLPDYQDHLVQKVHNGRYAYSYYHVYRGMMGAAFSFLGKREEYRVLSVGCGSCIDLLAARSVTEARVNYQGVDPVSWSDRASGTQGIPLIQALSRVADYFSQDWIFSYDVLSFPMSFSEMGEQDLNAFLRALGSRMGADRFALAMALRTNRMTWDEGRLWCHADLVLDEETCQDNCMRMVLTLAQVADEKIPEFMEIISNAPIPRPAS